MNNLVLNYNNGNSINDGINNAVNTNNPTVDNTKNSNNPPGDENNGGNGVNVTNHDNPTFDENIGGGSNIKGANLHQGNDDNEITNYPEAAALAAHISGESYDGDQAGTPTDDDDDARDSINIIGAASELQQMKFMPPTEADVAWLQSQEMKDAEIIETKRKQLDDALFCSSDSSSNSSSNKAKTPQISKPKTKKTKQSTQKK
eukprot:1218858-Ditylum_brightwellii.AAC.1